ncbi:hypothetical protein [Cellvibrio japonicus]|uniref:DUF5683 domain-containing protein n=1 Tax=Cellvibrio japonicus (strain Ueda107) TaxID=498211 RepID=B3PF59_CELJU|nr:hypothetical protein [Cellvibrio japonicus]ACE83914.1 conserved hypothetical protein [Cellvibrio japonicus Ueda107]QEI13614.1 hypothetical protein FY117_16280 [Cellvibrio japonicus]QEI17188.1 hypothetical protein FY116_16285 [Cellvibrio japonicus]QEI20765.1 hypothetical protein FY115_16280 [Cellvibrio japonicus]
MKISTKAALYSAFIFPGAGLWYLKHHSRALVFGIPALLAVIYLFVGAWRIAQRIAEDLSRDILATGQFNLNLGEILLQVRQATAADPSLEQAQWFFVAAWLISIFSSYAVGRLQEQQGTSPDTPPAPKE